MPYSTIIWGVLCVVGVLLAVSKIALRTRIDLRIGLGIALAAVSLFVLSTDLPEYGIGFSILGTLIIAGAALMAIKQTEQGAKTDRRERKLLEIITWATEIVRCEAAVPVHLLNPAKLKNLLSESGKLKTETLSQDIERIVKWHNADEKFQVMVRYKALANVSRRIMLMARQLDNELGSNLQTLTQDVCSRLQAHIGLAPAYVRGEDSGDEYGTSLGSLMDRANALAEEAEAKYRST